jgi:hypothetical protein
MEFVCLLRELRRQLLAPFHGVMEQDRFVISVCASTPLNPIGLHGLLQDYRNSNGLTLVRLRGLEKSHPGATNR